MPLRSRLFTEQFTASVLEGLTDDDRRTLAQIDCEQATSDNERLAQLLASLFARAPQRALKTISATQCSSIVSGCLATLRSHDAKPREVACNIYSEPHWCGLFLAVADRPFLVSSIAECLYEQKIALHAFQHPIVSYRGHLVAVSYIEIASRSRADISDKLPILCDTINALSKVVEDHSSMLTCIEEHFSISSNASAPTRWGNNSSEDISDFVTWLTSGTFFFLGTQIWNSHGEITRAYGLLQSNSDYKGSLCSYMLEDLVWQKNIDIYFSIHKLPMRSIVHRRAPVIHIALRKKDSSDAVVSIIGYFTSKAWACEAEDIPLLNRKVEYILQSEHTPPNSHDYKYVREVLDNIPLDDALRLPVEHLRSIGHTALGLFSEEDTRTNVSIDTQRRWALTTLIFAPEKYSAEIQSDIQTIVESHFGAPIHSSEVNLDTSKKRQIRLYISTPLPAPPINLDNVDALEQRVHNATLDWEEKLAEHPETTFNPLQTSFSDPYQAAVSIEEAAHDYQSIALLNTTNPLHATLFSSTEEPTTPTLTCVSLNESVSLTTTIPVLENFGLEVLDANSYEVRHNGQDLDIVKFVVQLQDSQSFDITSFNELVCPTLTKILLRKAIDDPLNVLIVTTRLTSSQVNVLRCFCALLWQTHKIATKRTMFLALATNPIFVKRFIEAFHTRFDPDKILTIEERTSQASEIEDAALGVLRDVSNISHDRILRALIDLLRNTVRTSFFQQQETITLKLASQNVQSMPSPRPLYELFVFSSRIEGTHLRSAKVARGGIRWSERLDDYRSEVLGLMKTQRVKNVIIVPNGAKGGFIIKRTSQPGPITPNDIELGYREYITALLSVTDNIRNDETIHPDKTVIHDEPDPYLVVAADKGTATFSDLANDIAVNDFHFWLGDAFASGGSAGYDHKKYGITAKGAWQCVIRHAKDAGIDLEQPFSTIGIGDMSGDVFGNGMLVSTHLVLVGAFNHKHIFVDPNPDPIRAYAERQRLFSLPRSQWSDYDQSAISNGGGVFDRNAKEIELTPVMREALAVDSSITSPVNGEQLISILLRAPVTLLWNGGIGTYVKSPAESNAEVNDGANDGVRVNADELRCAIVGEGGNLGFTQLARVDCARRGIRINTDAIDNSGGVDLSDYEVNLKLLFQPLIKNKAIQPTKRNEILSHIADEVVSQVLGHNQSQSLLLSMSELCSPATVEQFRQLIRMLEGLGIVDRLRDTLPDEQELESRILQKQGMLRPELALCSAGVKMWLKSALLAASPSYEEEWNVFLAAYFPSFIQEQYTDEITSHPLRNEIIINQMVESVTISTGISFIPTLFQQANQDLGHIVKCCLAANRILDFNTLRERIHTIDTYQSFSLFSTTWKELTDAIRQATRWLITTHPNQTSFSELVTLYTADFHTLIDCIDQILSPSSKEQFVRTNERYKQYGLSIQDAKTLAICPMILEVLEILWCTRQYGQDVRSTVNVTGQTLDALMIRPLFELEFSLSIQNKWDQELAATALQQLRRGVSRIVGKLLTISQLYNRSTARMLSQLRLTKELTKIMVEIGEDIAANKTITISILPLVAQYIERIHKSLEAEELEAG